MQASMGVSLMAKRGFLIEPLRDMLVPANSTSIIVRVYVADEVAPH